MSLDIMHTAVMAVPLNAGNGGGVLNLDGLTKFLIGIGGLLLTMVGLWIIGRSKKADTAEVANISLNAAIGILFLGLGAGTFSLVAFGEKISNLLFGSGS
jgi:hypothetical protein